MSNFNFMSKEEPQLELDLEDLDITSQDDYILDELDGMPLFFF